MGRRWRRVRATGALISRKYRRTLKVLPWPTALRSVSSPPMRLVSRLVMVRPRPVPASLARRPALPRSKGWKMRSWSCGAMPMPVSSTSKRTTSCRQSTRSTTAPRLVKRTALPSRLMRIWRRRLASACTQAGTRPWVSRRNARPLPSAWGCTIRASSERNSWKGSGAGSSLRRPASMRARSSRPSISACMCWPLCWMVVTASRALP